jgi:hypothetical protein
MLRDILHLEWLLTKVKQVTLMDCNLVSNVENKIVPAVGHTTFRPPYTPVTIGAIVVKRNSENTLNQLENLQYIIGTKKIMQFLLTLGFG